MTNEIEQAVAQSPALSSFINGKNNLGNLGLMEEALLLGSAFRADQKPRIIVKKNKYEAQQLYERLAMLEDGVVLFAMEESLRVQAIASSPQEKVDQIDALMKIRQGKAKLIVVNAAAFTRFLPDPEFFDSFCTTIKTGEQLSMKELKEHLNRSGYARVHYCEVPGSYASRGGIVDIFPIGKTNPVRIEFFDTEVDSIRMIDANTQRTISTLHEITLSPASDVLFTDVQLEEIRKSVPPVLEKQMENKPEEDAQFLQDAIEADLRDLESFSPENRLYRYYSWVKSARLTDYIDCDIILSPVEQVRESAKKVTLDNASYMNEEVQDLRALPRYTMFHELDKLLKNKNVMEIHQFMDLHDPMETGIRTIDAPSVNYMQWIAQEGSKDHVYFSLEKEDQHILAEKMDISKLKMTEPIYYQGFQAQDVKVYTGREIFRHQNRRVPYQKTFKEGTVLQNALELETGDYVVHAQYGIGQYLGIVTRETRGVKADYLHIAYRGGDDLYVPLSQFQLVRKYVSKEGTAIKLSKLGSGQWEKTKAKVSERVEEIAGRLVDLYAARNEEIGFAFPKDSALEEEFDEEFEHIPTSDQIQAEREIKEEMEKKKPMDHLLIGDVGFGKTEVAMRCAYKAITAGKQAAFLCPTTILSMQHFKTLSERFEFTGAKIALVNRFTSAAEFKKICEGLEDGTIDIVVGTHKLFNKKIQYKDLGFLIIDEEQRFGVEHKEKIKEMKNSIDVLSLSATPIPRTLQMSLIGVRTISQLNTPPAHRHPIQTYVMEKKGTVVEEVISRELARDGQVFYLHNRVQDLFRIAADLQKAFPDASVGVAHGRMSREEIEQVMLDFSQGKYQILVCTTIIETGLDIANANTIIIDEADRFGLSQLYQIRGRVGRRDKLAYCYLMVNPSRQLNEEANKRLKSIKEFTQLGSGYKIAMRDLTIRGAGDMLGPQQAGFIDQIGLDLYLEMLAEAIARKQGKAPEEKEPEKTAQIVKEGYIPERFTSNDGDKLQLYQEVKKIKTLQQLDEYEKRTADLFGKIPAEVASIFESRKLDLFVNQAHVDSLKENGNRIVIVMSQEYSRNIDGLRLFEAMNKASRQIKLSYHNSRIQVEFEKKKSYMPLLKKVIDILNDSSYYKRTK